MKVTFNYPRERPARWRCFAPMFGAFSLLAAGCSEASPGVGGRSGADEGPASPGGNAGADAGLRSTQVHASDVPIDGLSPQDVRVFEQGDAIFDVPFRAPDGLGPLYIRTSCGACHDGAARGPGLVKKMAAADTDAAAGAEAPDGAVQDDAATARAGAGFPWGHTVREGLAAGAITPVVPAPDAPVKVTIRLGPPVLGRGYLEAVADSEIERVEAEQAVREDGIRGRIHRVTFTSVMNPDSSVHRFQTGQTNLIGRFGLKARIATIDDFTADAFQGDMGITTPMRPTELPNPDGLSDDERPGVDLDIDRLNLVADYVRRIAIPPRVGLTAEGRASFDQARCSVCHVPSLRTRADYPIAVLADTDAAVYTDLLLHDMGDALADGIDESGATGRQWRTAPLIGVRFSTTFMHDGRAATVEDAILAHGGEAAGAAAAYSGLSPSERDALRHFVESL